MPWRSPDGSIDFLGQRTYGAVKNDLQDLSGLSFHLKDFRSTFGQAYIDKGADTPSVSKSMRHSTTKTTETYHS